MNGEKTTRIHQSPEDQEAEEQQEEQLVQQPPSQEQREYPEPEQESMYSHQLIGVRTKLISKQQPHSTRTHDRQTSTHKTPISRNSTDTSALK